jgi:catechol 2,3-dioxygenase-like lactoylglutathione lyase family enzyme
MGQSRQSQLAFVVIFAVLLLPCVALPQQAPSPWVLGVGPIEITVSDADRALKFYSEVLSFEKVSDQNAHDTNYLRLEGASASGVRVVRMRLGDEYVELVQFAGTQGRPVPADSRSNDRWFQHIAIVVSDMPRAYERLRDAHVEQISFGPQRLPDWNIDAAGIEAFYFRDPDRHALEVIHFPPDKGQSKWHAPANKLFLGIDHSAIAIGDTNTSLRFYRDLLGLPIVGRSDNSGIAQERLSGVPGAVVHITSLRASSGPGIELLEYRSPQNGRPISSDERATDLVHWEITLMTANAKGASEELRKDHARFISRDPITLKETELGFREGFVVRDPDGHALRFVEP